MENTTYAIAIILLVGCGTPQQKTVAVPPEYLIVGLDLSNRLEADGQIERDLAVMDAIIMEFETGASLSDRISVQVIPQKGAPDYSSVAELHIDLREIRISEIRDELPRRAEAMRSAVRAIYKDAEGITDHSGADSWGWLRDLYLPETTVFGDTIQHSVFLVTDGYTEADGLNFTLGEEATFIPQKSLELSRECAENSTPFQMLPARDDLQNVSILTLEVRPRVDVLCEFKILEGVLDRWYESMNVGYHEIHRGRSDTRATRDIISKFLNRR